jgi:response regulator of citrate/malate metabolism
VIIFITGYSEPSVHASALAASANDFMIKPINFGQLEMTLKKYLRKKYKPHKTFLKGVL